MKILKQFLVAGAALSFVNPIASQASNVNLDAMKSYSNISDSARFTNDFNIAPGNFVYQLIKDLANSRDCSFDVPDRSISRFEAATIVNSCLSNVAEITTVERSLIDEFSSELGLIRRRIDLGEARLNELEAGIFSKSSTIIEFDSNFIYGGNNFSGSDWGRGDADAFSSELGKTQFFYDFAIDIDTTFDGNDLLKTTLKTGNLVDESPFSGESNLNGWELPNNELFNSFTAGSAIELERLFYALPIGESYRFLFGLKIRQNDILASKTTAYNEGKILDFFTYSGAPAAYNSLDGPGLGWVYEKQGYSLSASYISENNLMMTSDSVSSTSIQLGYSNANWGIASIYNYTQGGVPIEAGTDEANDRTDAEDDDYTSFAISAFFQPSDKKIIPSFSTGWEWVTIFETEEVPRRHHEVNSWYVGLQWDNLNINETDSFGFAVGQTPYIVKTDDDDGYLDWNYAYEIWYKHQLNDNFSITPALFYFYRQLGAEVSESSGDEDATFNNLGFVLRASFKF